MSVVTMRDEPYSLFLGDTFEGMKDIPDESIDMVLCDLPYGTTACKWDMVIPFDPLWAAYKRVCKKNAAIVLTASQPFTSALVMSNLAMFKYCWVWEKNRATNFPNAKYRPMTAHEDVAVFCQSVIPYNPQKTCGHTPTNSATGSSQGTIYHGDNIRNYKGGDTSRFPRTVQRFDCERGYHPTQKPVALMEYLIKTYTLEGEMVLENAMGSGTTGVACINTGRMFIGIERDESYYEIAKNRIIAAREQGFLLV